ncbi:hypothetical protein [Achromobacter sp.]|uniref:hypothetical protein n=1 Tax=Achromobacter sp. TaxID=134375 RepID=UPI002F943806
MRTNQFILLDHGFQPEYEAGFASSLARNGWTVASAGSRCVLVALGLQSRWFLGAQLAGVLKKAARARLGWQA